MEFVLFKENWGNVYNNPVVLAVTADSEKDAIDEARFFLRILARESGLLTEKEENRLDYIPPVNVVAVCEISHLPVWHELFRCLGFRNGKKKEKATERLFRLCQRKYTKQNCSLDLIRG